MKRSVLDSPLAEADARDLFASWRIGLWLGLLVTITGTAAFAVAAAYFESDAVLQQIVVRLGIGRLLVAAVQAATALFLALAIPIRTAGLIEGPRWRGYFDQLVASGLPPWRYFAGRALVAQAFLGLALAATLPITTVFALVDPPPLRPIVEGYVALVIWGELLLALTLGLSAVVHELLAVVATIALALALTGAAVAPVPSVVAALSPVRTIATGIVMVLPDEDPGFLGAFYGAPRPFGVELPLLPYGAGLSAALALLALASCLVGPQHAFVPGFNGFGGVVLPGDKNRAAIRRVRPVLLRRAELAFFFENRGERLDRLAPWIRAGQLGLALALVGTLGLAAFLDPAVVHVLAGQRPDEDLVLHAAVPLAIVAAIAPWLLASGRNDARLSVTIAGRSLPVVLLDLIVYALAAWWLLGVALVALARFALAAQPHRLSSGFAVVGAGFEWGAIVLLVGFTAVVLQKVIGLRTYGRLPGVVVAILLVLGGNLVPVVRDPRELEDPDFTTLAARPDDEPLLLRTDESNARALAGLHLGFGVRLKLAIDPKTIDGVRLPERGAWRWLAYHGFWVIWPTLDVLLALAVLQLVALRRREGREELERVARDARESAAPGAAKP